MKTTVINLLSGPSAGKSTTAAKIYAHLKDEKVSVELVREYAKDYAWEGRKIDPLTQLHLLGEQSYRESLLYNKVQFIITDSPLILSSFYHSHYSQKDYLWSAILGFMRHSAERGVSYKNIFLARTKTYDPNGRFETEEEALVVDEKLKQYLDIRVDYDIISYDDFDGIVSLIKEEHNGLEPGGSNFSEYVITPNNPILLDRGKLISLLREKIEDLEDISNILKGL